MYTQKTLRGALNFAQTENPKSSRGEYPIKMMELFQNNNTSARGPLTLYQYKAVIGVNSSFLRKAFLINMSLFTWLHW